MNKFFFILIFTILLFSCKKEKPKETEEKPQEQLISEPTAGSSEDADFVTELTKKFAVESDMWQQKLERYNSTHQYALVSRAWNVGLETFLYTFENGVVIDSLQVGSQFDGDQSSAVQEFKEYTLDHKLGRVEIRDIIWAAPDSLVKDGFLIRKADSLDWEMQKDTVTNVYLMRYGKLQLVETKLPEGWHAELYCDTIMVQGKQFIGCHNSETNFYLLNETKDTVYKHPEYIYDAEYIDFDGDGNIDIRFDYMTNIPGIQDLLLFDEKKNTFKEVKEFSNFPSAIRIENTKLYYSYHRSGCADSDWDSDLFIIENFRAKRIGNINGVGCESNFGDGKTGIFIYTVDENGGQSLIKEILREPGYYDDKFEFIEEYWTKNYHRFN